MDGMEASVATEVGVQVGGSAVGESVIPFVFEERDGEPRDVRSKRRDAERIKWRRTYGDLAGKHDAKEKREPARGELDAVLLDEGAPAELRSMVHVYTRPKSEDKTQQQKDDRQWREDKPVEFKREMIRLRLAYLESKAGKVVVDGGEDVGGEKAVAGAEAWLLTHGVQDGQVE